MKNTKDEIEYLILFSNIYGDFLEGNEQLKEQLSDFYLDFDDWKITENGTGFTNIWVEPKKELIYKPAFKSPFHEVEIKGLRLELKTKTQIINQHKVINFEVAGHFNPKIWRGKNNLSLQPVGESIVTGYCRTIIEQDNFFSPYFLKYIGQNYSNFIFSSVKFFS